MEAVGINYGFSYISKENV